MSQKVEAAMSPKKANPVATLNGATASHLKRFAGMVIGAGIAYAVGGMVTNGHRDTKWRQQENVTQGEAQRQHITPTPELQKVPSSPAKSFVPPKPLPPEPEATLSPNKPAETTSTIQPTILQKPGTGSEPQPISNLSGRWIDDGNGVFDVKHEGDKVSWRGRSPDGGKQWSNVFDGRLVKNGNCYLIVGSWKDVSPGSYTGRGTLMLLVDKSNSLRAIEETGGYCGTVWSRQEQPVPRPVGLLALNTDPAKFDGQTITVQGQVSGKLFQGKGRQRLSVSGPKGIVSGDKVRLEGINFVIKNEWVERWLGHLQTDEVCRVRLTVTVRREGGGHWFAVVSDVEHLGNGKKD